MPRPSKRKAGEIDFEDPMTFVVDYCNRRGVTQNPGNSAIEKECANRAMEAREEYKEKRDASTASNSGNGAVPAEDLDRRGLSPAQKYTIRLQNNRKSANASKVYNEVFKRELSQRLQNIADPSNMNKDCQNCRDLTALHTKCNEQMRDIYSMQGQIDELQYQAQQREQQLCELRAENDHLSKSLVETQANLQSGVSRNEVAHVKNDPDDNLIQSSAEVCTPESCGHESRRRQKSHFDDKSNETRSQISRLLEAGRICDSPGFSEARGILNGTHRKDTLASRSEYDAGRSEKEVSTMNDTRAAEVESKVIHTPRSHASASPQASFTQRMASAGLLSFLGSENESQCKMYHTGLTLTPSQNEDTEDKTQLLRSFPSSGGIPTGYLGSQASQALLPPIKSSLGSEDLQLGGESDLFLASQGSTGTPGKLGGAP